MKQHALSACYPAMAAEAFEKLTADIKAHGLRHKIVLHKGQVLDGWHRYQACLKAGITPQTIDYNGDDPVAWVRSANKHRRHMTASQDAMTEVSISEWAPSGVHPRGDSESPHETVAEMAENSGTDERTIQRAKRVVETGTTELKEAVRDGAISVSKAAQVAKLPKQKQAAAMKEKPAKVAKPETVPKTKFDALKSDHDELSEQYEDARDMLKTVEAVTGSGVAIEMAKLRVELKTCTRRRNELMAQAVEIRRQISFWEKQAKKLGWKAKK